MPAVESYLKSDLDPWKLESLSRGEVKFGQILHYPNCFTQVSIEPKKNEKKIPCRTHMCNKNHKIIREYHLQVAKNQPKS